ncbi:hypothetical protein Bca101_005663 [Brassica carinata]
MSLSMILAFHIRRRESVPICTVHVYASVSVMSGGMLRHVSFTVSSSIATCMRHASGGKIWNRHPSDLSASSAIQSPCLLMIDPISGFFTTKPLLIIGTCLIYI